MKSGERKRLKDLGSRIRSIREKQGISQAQLAYECGLSRAYIGLVERGVYNPTIITLWAIAEVFGVTVHELLSFE